MGQTAKHRPRLTRGQAAIEHMPQHRITGNDDQPHASLLLASRNADLTASPAPQLEVRSGNDLHWVNFIRGQF